MEAFENCADSSASLLEEDEAEGFLSCDFIMISRPQFNVEGLGGQDGVRLFACDCCL